MHSNRALASAVREGLESSGLSIDCRPLVQDAGREHVAALLGATGRVDLCIPRGGASLMAMVDECAKVPVIRHGQGICHVFLDESAEPTMAVAIAHNAKVQRPGVCNAMETLLVHRAHLSNGVFERVAFARSRGHAARGQRERDCARSVGRAVRGCEHEQLGHRVPRARARGAGGRLARRSAGWPSSRCTEPSTQLPSSRVTALRLSDFFARSKPRACCGTRARASTTGGELGLGAEMSRLDVARMHAWGPIGTSRADRREVCGVRRRASASVMGEPPWRPPWREERRWPPGTGTKRQ